MGTAANAGRHEEERIVPSGHKQPPRVLFLFQYRPDALLYSALCLVARNAGAGGYIEDAAERDITVPQAASRHTCASVYINEKCRTEWPEM
jgi:hypothetical protein